MTHFRTPPARPSRRRLVARCAALPIAALAIAPSPALAQGDTDPRFTDPAAIDRAVAEFTGAAIGAVGGARAAADRRLRLARCDTPLTIAWHGATRSSVQVECAGPQAWRIFVATRPAPGPQATAPVINRGDPVSVLVRGRGFSVQQSGEAMESGGPGDWIAIRMAARADPIRARIERPGLAVIPAN